MKKEIVIEIVSKQLKLIPTEQDEMASIIERLRYYSSSLVF